MYGYLNGEVIGRLGQKILVKVDNIGYWVFTGSWQPAGKVECYIHHHIKEDISDLFGFENLVNLKLFEDLIAVSGVGPKAALSILSIGTANQIYSAIAQDNAKYLSLAPGVGGKVAQKIIIELKNKIQKLDSNLTGSDLPDIQSDLFYALESLGYKSSDVSAIINKMPSNILELEEQIKWVLGSKNQG